MIYHDLILAITLRVNLQALPPKSIKPAKYSGRGTPVGRCGYYFPLFRCMPLKGLFGSFPSILLESLLVSRSVLNNTSWYLQRHHEKVRDKTPLPRVLLIQARDHSTGIAPNDLFIKIRGENLQHSLTQALLLVPNNVN